MNKNAIFSHFSKILDNMIDNSLFFDTFFQEMYSIDDIYGTAGDTALPFNVNLFFGATRACLIDNDYDYVVKFDVSVDGNGDSACEREKEIYSYAKQYSLNQCFAEIEYIGSYTRTYNFYDAGTILQYVDYNFFYGEEYDNEFKKYEDNFGEMKSITISIPLYACPKAEYVMIDPCDPNNDVYKIINKINSPITERNTGIAFKIITEYGKEIYQKLTDFMFEMNINDIHCGNVGNINGHFCFTDYAGYHSPKYYSETDELFD